MRWHTYGISVEGRFIYPQEIKFVFDDPLAFADGFFQLKAVRILIEPTGAAVDQASEPGEIGRILRREVLYCSQLSKWRRQRLKGSSSV